MHVLDSNFSLFYGDGKLCIHINMLRHSIYDLQEAISKIKESKMQKSLIQTNIENILLAIMAINYYVLMIVK